MNEFINLKIYYQSYFLLEFLSEQAETVAERLVQSILCGAASKDPRFKSKYLVVLHRDRIVSDS